MSFSVQAKEFIPAAFSWNSVLDKDTAAATPTTTVPGPIGKGRVCMAFYEYAECPYDANCEHAHHFTELDVDTQAKLLESVPCESIPSHFVIPRSAAVPTAYRVPPTLTAYGHFNKEKKPTCTPVARDGRNPPNSSAGQALDTSMSSHTSSLDTQIGSAHRSKNSSPGLEGFRMRLPARCRFPHRAITGTYYDVLGLHRNAAMEDILLRYRVWQREGFKRMRLSDPQRAEAIDRLMVEARNVLGNDTLRSEYDRLLPTVPAVAATESKKWVAAAVDYSSPNTSSSHRRAQGHSSSSSTNSEQQEAVFSRVVVDPSRTSTSTPTLTTAMFSGDIW